MSDDAAGPGGTDSEPFAFRAGKEGAVFISRGGREVTVLRGKAAARFLARTAGVDEAGVQLEMARVTGNYRRGNERRAKQSEGRKQG